MQLEMKYLSKVTGEPVYWDRAELVIKAIESQKREDGLLPIYIYPATGEFREITSVLDLEGTATTNI